MKVDNRGNDVLVVSGRFSGRVWNPEGMDNKDSDADVVFDRSFEHPEGNPREVDSKDNATPIRSGCLSG